MSEYKEDLEAADRFMGIGVKWLIIAVVALTGIGFWMNTAGVFGQKVVERKVLENSYQYSEARKTEITTMEAQLAEIDVQLSNPDLDSQTKRNLEAQKSAINVRLKAAREKAEKVLLND